ncbi:MAG: hypothetical protein MZV70_71590 [Desulfobacterales bacterium]|nr:hypothetical protein [Desulfobacterales bacterium]
MIELDPRTGYMSIFGGKLTDCLNVGREVSAALHTFGIRLPFRRTKWYGEPDRKIRDEFLHRAALLGLDAMTAPESSEPMSTRLWRRYGWRALSLLEDIRQDPRMAEVLIQGTEYTRCELYHAAQHEMVTKLEDFLRRRSKIALIARRDTIRQAPGSWRRAAFCSETMRKPASRSILRLNHQFDGLVKSRFTDDTYLRAAAAASMSASAKVGWPWTVRGDVLGAGAELDGEHGLGDHLGRARRR